ncbi:MAG: alpha-D-glucose phosphate-specific phosphoglucomutase [Gammaproteobacteria bacterium]|nr:alpha-D-glucose phosphate-specific phosphoglucomutase [Gammaproteobacteria bacterium]
MKLSTAAGHLPTPDMLVDVPKLITAYYTETPDPGVPTERVAFGTSGHRGSAFHRSFNEAHILAITEAICRYRKQQGITGPLFLGMDTHALSVPAHASALEVLAAHGIDVMIATGTDYTPTPAVSHAILAHNRGRSAGLADGILITPSHNPPQDGGFKYNPPNGGPAGTDATTVIEKLANELLAAKLEGVQRVSYETARLAATTHTHDYLTAYVADLASVVDMEAIAKSGVKLGVDPLGGAGVHYWGRIAEHYRLDLTVVNPLVDPTFRFMTVDWDGQLRMDPSSTHVMQSLVGLKDRFQVAFACDADHDRHGIVTRSTGLLAPNHYLAVAIDHLFSHRPGWRAAAGIGKTLVSSSMIDRLAARLGRTLVEVPVGFKWFVDGLYDGTLGFGGEESAGASFLRRDGTVWSTDKDGLILNLLAAEITAVTGKDPGERYRELTQEFGAPYYDRIDAPATPAQKDRLKKLEPAAVTGKTLAGERIEQVLSRAPGNDQAIGGIKVVAANGWFAARPSGTENIYKIYAESFKGRDHLEAIIHEAQALVGAAIAGS